MTPGSVLLHLVHVILTIGNPKGISPDVLSRGQIAPRLEHRLRLRLTGTASSTRAIYFAVTVRDYGYSVMTCS